MTREHGMAAALNGMALHGGTIAFGGTFLMFNDYMKPAYRLAHLMGVQSIFVFTHDSGKATSTTSSKSFWKSGSIAPTSPACA